MSRLVSPAAGCAVHAVGGTKGRACALAGRDAPQEGGTVSSCPVSVVA